MRGLEPRCKTCVGDEVAEALFIRPCHRMSLEERTNGGPGGTSCLSCGAAAPGRRETEPTWRWFWEKESRAAPTMFFVADLTSGTGDIAVPTMARPYVPFQRPSNSPWLPAELAGLRAFAISRVASVAFFVLFSVEPTQSRENLRRLHFSKPPRHNITRARM